MTDRPSSIHSGSSPEAQPPSTGSLRIEPSSAVRLGADAGSVSDSDATVISSRPPLNPSPDGAAPLKHETVRDLQGQMLEYFELQEYLGGGGMGAVFKALDTRLKRSVALKVLRRDAGEDPESVRRFRKEAEAAARLDHENIARVYYVGHDRGYDFIVFELIEGINLRELVYRRGPLGAAEAVNYTLQAAQALAHASSRDVVHRDIKPSNLIITAQGRAKIVDMGLSRALDLDASTNNDLTASGVTLGTFDYISPEQALDPRGADVRSDIYSLGCTLYFMLAGQPPFPDGNPFQKLLRHKGDAPPDLRQFNPDLPDELIRVVNKMLAKDPRSRHQTAGELVFELSAVARLLGMPEGQPLGSLALAPPRSGWTRLDRHLPWAVPLAILLLSVAAMELLPTLGTGDSALPPPVTMTSPDDPDDLGPSLPGAGTAGRDPVPPAASAIAGDTTSGNGGSGEVVTEPAVVVSPPNEPPAVAADRPTTDAQPAESPFAEERPSRRRVTSSAAAAGVSAGVSNAAHITAAGEEPAAATVSAADLPGPPESRSPGHGPLAGQGVWIVSDEPGGPTLEAACQEAASGDVVLLRFTGRRLTRPLHLRDKNLVIKADEGFSPVLYFQPAEGEDPVGSPRAMFHVVGGELSLRDVAVEIDFPCRQPTDDPWAIFRSEQADAFRLQDCVLTIRNATLPDSAHFHRRVAFFDVLPPPGDDMASGDHLLQVVLKDCVVRGEAVLLRVDSPQAVGLAWNNGLLATTKRLLEVRGGRTPPEFAGRVQVQLESITADCREGLVLLTSREDLPYQNPVELRATDCILLTAAEAPLVEQHGTLPIGEARQRFAYHGRRNFYDGVQTFWKVTQLGRESQPANEVRDDFAAWQQHWGMLGEDQSRPASVLWERSPRGIPIHRVWSEHYTLADAPANLARQAAAGCRLDELPPLPPERFAEPTAQGSTSF